MQTMQWIQSILFSKTNKIDGRYMTNILKIDDESKALG